VDAALGDSLANLTAAAQLVEQAFGFAPQQLKLAADSARITPAFVAEQRDLRPEGFGAAAEFHVTGFAGLDAGITRLSVQQLQQTLRSGAFVEEVNRLRKQLQDDFNLDRTTSITVAGLSLGVSVVYVLWLILGGVLLGSYLSALPAWRMIDPLPVLARTGDDEEQDDDEALPPDADQAPDPLRGFA
jgi:hypothetical protein